MAAVKSAAVALGAWIVFEDEAGFAMMPPRARTWDRCGHTPVVRVRGTSRRRISVAALCPVESVWSLLRRGPTANTAFDPVAPPSTHARRVGQKPW
ncbi:hypothetical protein [Streptomyces sp. NBC_00842]|uniref:hypothetical protein n=1 Tax=unclassified Streptomyces TaxID=2593676 RepID=UPI003863579C